MARILVVVRPFDGQAIGDLISDKIRVAGVLGSPHASDAIPVMTSLIADDSLEEM